MPDDQNCPRSLADRVVALLNTEFSQAEQTVAEITARYEAAAKKTDLISEQLDRQRKDGEASRETASARREAAAANPERSGSNKGRRGSRGGCQSRRGGNR